MRGQWQKFIWSNEKAEENGSRSASIGEEGHLMSLGLSYFMSLLVVGVVKG